MLAELPRELSRGAWLLPELAGEFTRHTGRHPTLHRRLVHLRRRRRPTVNGLGLRALRRRSLLLTRELRLAGAGELRLLTRELRLLLTGIRRRSTRDRLLTGRILPGQWLLTRTRHALPRLLIRRTRDRMRATTVLRIRRREITRLERARHETARLEHGLLSEPGSGIRLGARLVSRLLSGLGGRLGRGLGGIGVVVGHRLHTGGTGRSVGRICRRTLQPGRRSRIMVVVGHSSPTCSLNEQEARR
ncbi:hypothetical protein ACFO5K_21960 [Nocardia halotolerans]|uniref:Uncharacterized protein n=1 Tax=Nocardia halotolerans TaxID=1755878 RepID=A0ABV8VQQ0_9NOCA